jgi:hypothetical protein
MRMWMIDPRLMCRKHLLGEHSELHKHRPSFVKHYRIDGRMNPVVQIEPSSMGDRHTVLVSEMLRRGYRHDSPYTMPDISYLPEDYRKARVDMNESVRSLSDRCDECRCRIEEFVGGSNEN